MKRSAFTAFLCTVLCGTPALWAQVRWTDMEGKVHVTDKMPKQDQVTAEEWARLQTEEENRQKAEAANAEKLPDLAAGVILKWKDRKGVEHNSNAAPLRSEVTDAEWERLKAEIPKLNESMAKQAPAEVPKAAEPAPAEAGGEKLPDLPAGKTLMWTGKDGKSNMTSTPPRSDQVTKQEWERLKKAIDEMIEEAKSAPPAPEEPPAPAETPAPEGATPPAEGAKPEGGSASLGPSGYGDDGVLEVACEGEQPSPGKYEVKGKITNRSADKIAREVKVAIDVLSDRKRIAMQKQEPLLVAAALYPGISNDFTVRFEIPSAYPRTSLTCEARVLSADIRSE